MRNQVLTEQELQAFPPLTMALAGQGSTVGLQYEIHGSGCRIEELHAGV
jgi:hypothetical protein